MSALSDAIDIYLLTKDSPVSTAGQFVILKNSYENIFRTLKDFANSLAAPTLQSVTDTGSTTSNSITIQDHNSASQIILSNTGAISVLGTGTNFGVRIEGGTGTVEAYNLSVSNLANTANAVVTFTGTANRTITIPDLSGALALSGAITDGQYTMTNNRLLGRYSGAVGPIQELTIGSGLAISGTSLIATGVTAGSLAASSFVEGETPTGLVNGSNATYAVAFDFVPETVEVFVNGLLQQKITHYNTSGTTTIIFADSPVTGDTILVNYIKA